ncbi:MBL fold metallo-hydrolase [Parasphingorhabdus sp.]|uniref:MBL fold metallo-hydrolase n=1 Tax=Parasphingorhabdus sp. TaxID=2709688 RepID=UPI002B266798|nr:MBL fold metallo-hydrolase [Parasphingorhabdus sp.]
MFLKPLFTALIAASSLISVADSSGKEMERIAEEKPFRGPMKPDLPIAKAYDEAARALAMGDDNPLMRWEYRVWCETGYRDFEEAGTGQTVDKPIDLNRDYISPKGFSYNHLARKLMPSGGVRFLDNAWYFGADGLGVVVVKTPEGLLVFDTMGRPEEFDLVALKEMPTAGLDPRDITHIFIGHYHWDHIGGANLIQEIAPNAKIVMGAPDAEILQRARGALLADKMPIEVKAILSRNAEPETPEEAAKLRAARLKAMPEKIDILISPTPGLTTGSRIIKTGKTTEVVAVLDPGHTPGQMSVIVPVRHEGNIHHLLVMSGNDEPSAAKQYALSMDYLRSVAADSGADTLINTHAYQSAMFYHLRQIAANPHGPNPFMMGADGVDRFLGIFANCQRAIRHRLADGTWLAF